MTTSAMLPVFEFYPWLPAPVIDSYQWAIPLLERTPVVKRFGVSTYVLARRPA